MAKRRVYHFCRKEHGLENIIKRRIKVSTFGDLNDPFELMCHHSSDEEFRKFLNDFKERASATRGLICFSKKHNNPVQWAHYSDRHRGLCLCLGFDIDSEFLEDVTYTPARIDFMDGLDLHNFDFDKQIRGMLLVKHEHWCYEQEARLFGYLGGADANGLHFKAFGSELELKEVVIGFKSDLKSVDLREALGAMAGSVECFAVVPSHSEYLMVRSDKDLL